MPDLQDEFLKHVLSKFNENTAGDEVVELICRFHNQKLTGRHIQFLRDGTYRQWAHDHRDPRCGNRQTRGEK